MHDVGITLDAHVLFDLNAAEFAYLADIVAPEVNKHVVLGKLLFVVQEFRFEALVLFVRRAAGTRAGKRECVQRSVFKLHQCFRGSAGYLHIVAGEEEHVRRRVGCPEHPVSVQQASVEISVKPVREHHLEYIALVDVVLRFLHHCAVLLLVEQLAKLRCKLSVGNISGLAVPDELFHFSKFLFSLCVFAVDILRGNVGYQHYLLVDIIERDNLIEKHQVNVLEVLLVLCVEVQRRLAVLDVVVREVPHQPACERRKSLQLGAAVPGHQLPDVVCRVGLPRGFHRAAEHVLYGEFTVDAGYLQLRVISKERVTSPFFLVLYALENVNVTAHCTKLFEHLYRRCEVREDLAAYRYNAVSGEFLCLFKSRFQHDFCSFRITKTPPLNAEFLCF